MEMIPTKINKKWTLLLPEHRAARPEWPTWEKERLASMRKGIKKGDVVYYIGSEEGDLPALCASWGAFMVLVEPNPKVWANTKAIWEANNLAMPIVCFEGFASSDVSDDWEDGYAVDEWPKNAYGEVIGDHGFKELYLEAEAYPRVTMDYLLDLQLIPYPDHITIDVEGSEWEVLKGMQKILSKENRPHIKKRPNIWLSLHPEFMFHQWGAYGSDLRGWIKGFGYSEKLLDYQHEVHLLYEPI